MADRFWVGDSGNWSDNTNHWSDSSGGAPGASKPSSSDNVFFNANSFSGAGQTVTVDEVAYCLDMDWTGAANTPTFAVSNTIIIYGSLTFITGITLTVATNKQINFAATSTGKTVTTAGKDLKIIDFISATGGWTLQDALTASVGFYIERTGGLSGNGKTINCGLFSDAGSTQAKVIDITGCTINCAGNFSFVATGLTLTTTGSVIKVTGTGAFVGAGNTYNELQLNGTAHTVTGNNTFTVLKCGRATAQTITFANGSTQTCDSFTSPVTGTNVLTLTGAAAWNISSKSRFISDYVTVLNSAATPSNIWYAGTHGVNSGGNTGWTFGNPASNIIIPATLVGIQV